MTNNEGLNPQPQKPEQHESSFTGWVETQALKPNEARHIIPEAKLVIRTIDGTTYREYYSDNSDSADKSNPFRQTAKATFYPDHSKESPHFELEMKLTDKDNQNVEQTISIRKNEVEYKRRDKVARLEATWRKFKITDKSRIKFSGKDMTNYLLDEAGYYPFESQGFEIRSHYEITNLNHHPIDSSKREMDAVLIGNDEQEKIRAKKKYDERIEVYGNGHYVSFTAHKNGRVSAEASITGDQIEEVLMEHCPESLIDSPIQENPDLDKWKDTDFLADVALFGRTSIYDTTKAPSQHPDPDLHDSDFDHT